jgi:hypothetical protein
MAGVNWNNVPMLTPGMKNLGNQINRRFPNRDPASDGAVGDYAHSQGTSGHNPDDTSHDNAEWDKDSDNKPEVRAIDVDADLREAGTTMQEVVDHIRRLPGVSSVLRYIIYNGRIYKASDGWNGSKYEGANDHSKHAHFSGAYTNASDANTTFNYKLDEVGDDMDLTTKNLTDIAKAVWDIDYLASGDTANPTWAAKSLVSYRLNTLDTNAKKILALVTAVAKEVDISPEELAAIKLVLDIPTAEENADAVVEALGGVDTQTLANTLRSVLTDQQRSDLIAALSA